MAGKRPTHCKKGHKFTPENTIIKKTTGRRQCKLCQENYRELNKEILNKRSAKWRLDNIERAREIERKHNHKRYSATLIYRREIWWKPYSVKLRTEILTHYGNGVLQCVCCGESMYTFLTIDHINGRTDYEKNNEYKFRGLHLCQYLKRQGFPEGYQTLCWNCNSGRANNGGVCPHKTDEVIMTKNKYHSKNPSKHTLAMRKYMPNYVKQLRFEVLTHYGNGVLACVCCGISELQFLNIDHINGRTDYEKKNGKERGWQLMRSLRKKGYPKGYQTLCWNCNSGKHLNKGICPHKDNALQVQG